MAPLDKPEEPGSSRSVFQKVPVLKWCLSQIGSNRRHPETLLHPMAHTSPSRAIWALSRVLFKALSALANKVLPILLGSGMLFSALLQHNLDPGGSPCLTYPAHLSWAVPLEQPIIFSPSSPESSQICPHSRVEHLKGILPAPLKASFHSQTFVATASPRREPLAPAVREPRQAQHLGVLCICTPNQVP